ncbi:hypothetical protein BT93_F2094 [Corymbia citriodora subsp. variegata]|nr:hypothetical protein BT93_F2094 [Corymbia citriodora subsp. variegata]
MAWQVIMNVNVQFEDGGILAVHEDSAMSNERYNISTCHCLKVKHVHLCEKVLLNCNCESKDMEDQATKISVEEQMLITTIQSLESDLTSAKSEDQKLKEETEQMMTAKGDICSQILDKQRKVASLESDCRTLTQTLELVRQERVGLLAKLVEKRLLACSQVSKFVVSLNPKRCCVLQLFTEFLGLSAPTMPRLLRI